MAPRLEAGVMAEVDRYIRTETSFSAVGSSVVTIILFLLTFGTAGPVAAWGIGAYVFDCFPQAFFTAMICTVLPGFITRKRAQSGGLAALGIAPSTVRRVTAATILRRSLIAGAASVAVVGPVSAAVFMVAGIHAIAWWPAFGAKLGIAVVVALIATPFGLRPLLRDLQVAGEGYMAV